VHNVQKTLEIRAVMTHRIEKPSCGFSSVDTGVEYADQNTKTILSWFCYPLARACIGRLYIVPEVVDTGFTVNFNDVFQKGWFPFNSSFLFVICGKTV
jgi:hypothetical protein